MNNTKVKNVILGIFGETNTMEVMISVGIIVTLFIGILQLFTGELFLPISLMSLFDGQTAELTMNSLGAVNELSKGILAIGSCLCVVACFIPYAIFNNMYDKSISLRIEIRSLIISVPAYIILSFLVNTISMM